MPDVYLSSTIRMKDNADGTWVTEYLNTVTGTWERRYKPATIYLGEQQECLIGFGDGYCTPVANSNYLDCAHYVWKALDFLVDIDNCATYWFALPTNFVATEDVRVCLFWYAPAGTTTGDVVWAAAVRSLRECLAACGELCAEVTVTDTTHPTELSIVRTDIVIPAATHVLVADDAVVLQVKRVGTDPCDTMLTTAHLIMAKFDFAIDEAMNFSVA